MSTIQYTREVGDNGANVRDSSSPLNGEAATLWDSNMEEFTKKVLARHRDITDDA